MKLSYMISYLIASNSSVKQNEGLSVEIDGAGFGECTQRKVEKKMRWS